MQKTTLLFDLDGTLIDSTEAILEGFGYAFEAFGLKVPPDTDIIALIGAPLEEMFERLGVPGSQIADFVQAYKAKYRTIHTRKTTLLPRAKEAIAYAHTFAKLGVVTTKTTKYSRILLEHFGIERYFQVIIGRQEVKRPKPDPEGVHLALESLGYEHAFGSAYMIGDTCFDTLAARRAHIRGIAVLSGYGTQGQLLACADLVVKDVFEAVEAIGGGSL